MRKSYNKKSLIADLSNQTGLSANYSKKLFEDYIQIIIDNICDGELKIKNFGVFKILKKAERIGRNPKTNKEYLIKSRKSLSFKPSKKLIEYLND